MSCEDALSTAANADIEFCSRVVEQLPPLERCKVRACCQLFSRTRQSGFHVFCDKHACTACGEDLATVNEFCKHCFLLTIGVHVVAPSLYWSTLSCKLQSGHIVPRTESRRLLLFFRLLKLPSVSRLHTALAIFSNRPFFSGKHNSEHAVSVQRYVDMLQQQCETDALFKFALTQCALPGFYKSPNAATSEQQHTMFRLQTRFFVAITDVVKSPDFSEYALYVARAYKCTASKQTAVLVLPIEHIFVQHDLSAFWVFVPSVLDEQNSTPCATRLLASTDTPWRTWVHASVMPYDNDHLAVRVVIFQQRNQLKTHERVKHLNVSMILLLPKKRRYPFVTA